MSLRGCAEKPQLPIKIICCDMNKWYKNIQSLADFFFSTFQGHNRPFMSCSHLFSQIQNPSFPHKHTRAMWHCIKAWQRSKFIREKRKCWEKRRVWKRHKQCSLVTWNWLGAVQEIYCWEAGSLSLSALTMCRLFHLVNKCLRSKGFLIVVMLTLESEATPLAFEGAKY